MTDTYGGQYLETARVFHGIEGCTAFAAPLIEGGYSFRVAANLWKIPTPNFEHRVAGDLILFPKVLGISEVEIIARYAGLGDYIHYPGRIRNFDAQLNLARATLGELR